MQESTGTHFRYRALDADGAQRSGQIQASDEPAALRALIAQGLTPLDVSAPAPVRVAAAVEGGGVAKASATDRSALVQELATLLGAGISLADALPSLAQAYAGHALGPALTRLDRDIRAGLSLSAGLAKGGVSLPPYVLAMVEAGEASGELAQALRDAAAQMEHERKVAQELRNALVYPAVLVLSGLAAVLIIFIGVVPRFASILKNSKADVPDLSRWIIESAMFVKVNWLAVALFVGVVLLGASVALAQPAVRERLFDALGRLPLIGHWLIRVDIGRWATVLGSLLANRVPMPHAVNLSQAALRLPRLRLDMAGTARELERGKSLSDVLGRQDWFPAVRLNLVRVGERSGELPRMLATLGEIETEAARVLQKRVLTLIEPIAILLIGAVIGVIMIAVMLAITSLNTAVY